MRFTVTLKDIFERFHTPSVIDYLSLDVEGAETFVMESFPFDRYRINALSVERADKKLCGMLQDNGYVQLKSLKSWGETLWVHSSVEATLDIDQCEFFVLLIAICSQFLAFAGQVRTLGIGLRAD